MPSLLHELCAVVVPRLRGAGDLDSREAERRRVEVRHATPATTDRVLPTGMVPRFARRYEVDVRRLPFPVHTIRPRGRRPRTTVYYLHGGGYVAPADAVHVRWATRLADHLDAEVVLPDHPLAPGHTWRDSREALVADLAEHTARQDRVEVGCRLLVDRAAAAGWPVTYLEAPDLIHVFPLLPGVPEAGRAWRRTEDFLR